MNGPVAQLVALTCHGNAFLQDQAVPQFFPINSTCTFCDEIIFVERPKLPHLGLRDEPIARNPDEWFSKLKTQGARALCMSRTAQRLPHITDRMSAGFVGGGGTWAVEVLAHEKTRVWMAHWQVWNQNDPDRRIWRVTYRPVSSRTNTVVEVPDICSVERPLLQALRETHLFAAENDCGGFTECFAKAIDTLTNRHCHGYHKDLAPLGFIAEKANLILDACQSAWVFGAMGSWNDMGFDGDKAKEYDRVSEQLYSALTNAICVATNTTANLPAPAAGQTSAHQMPFSFL